VSDAVLKLQPDLAIALFYRATALLRLDREDDPYAAFAQCRRVSPRATSCLRILGELAAQDGRCDDAEKIARELIAADPETPRWFLHLARAIYGSSQSVEAARAALEQKWERTPANLRPQVELEDRFYLDVLEWAFDHAIDRAQKWSDALVGVNAEVNHANVALMRQYLYAELGDRQNVADVARRFLSRRNAWSPDPNLDRSILSLTTQYRAGVITHDELVRDRERWEADAGHRPQLTPALSWVLAYAEAVRTKEDALEALRAIPKEHPFETKIERDVESDDAHGFVRLTAGDPQAALPFLKRAASSCTAVHSPFWQTRANLHLGEALEATGDVNGACAAYKVVLTRWGNDARSVSAQEARAHFQSLQCRG
jgi:tetratricopeptide (TPR) repeat protein